MGFNYALLEKVKAHIAEEPRRLQMDYWYPMDKEELAELPREKHPPCGTACCIGGWVSQLHGDICDPVIPALNAGRIIAIDGILRSLFYRYPFCEHNVPITEYDPWFGETTASADAACRAIDRAIVMIREVENNQP